MSFRAILERNFRMAREVLVQGEAENAGTSIRGSEELLWGPNSRRAWEANVRSDLVCVRQRSPAPKDPRSIPEIHFGNRSRSMAAPARTPSDPKPKDPQTESPSGNATPVHKRKDYLPVSLVAPTRRISQSIPMPPLKSVKVSLGSKP
jgi:hypothetical protein